MNQPLLRLNVRIIKSSIAKYVAWNLHTLIVYLKKIHMSFVRLSVNRPVLNKFLDGAGFVRDQVVVATIV